MAWRDSLQRFTGERYASWNMSIVSGHASGGERNLLLTSVPLPNGRKVTGFYHRNPMGLLSGGLKDEERQDE